MLRAACYVLQVNNPSNPCGSNYSREHLAGIAAVARKHNLPIISDEIYSRLVYDGTFTPLAAVVGDVPLLKVRPADLPTNLPTYSRTNIHAYTIHPMITNICFY